MRSYQCVHHVKRLVARKTKVGHAGTLDNFAQGLLLIAIGRKATRFIPQLMDLQKEYEATARLGCLTDTLDPTGTVVWEEKIPSSLDEQTLQKAVASFVGVYQQTPPLYSALKHKGKHLSTLARKGALAAEELEQIVQAKTRKITLYHLELTDFSPPNFSIRAIVSRGTYVRSLMDDIAQHVDSRATTQKLTRTRIGPFRLADAAAPDQIVTTEQLNQKLLSLEKVEKLIQS